VVLIRSYYAASQAAQAIPAKPIETDVSTQCAMDTAKQWIAECTANHKRCQFSGVPRLPSRVLDVGPAVDGVSVTLHITNPHSPEHQEYVALSYCWGGPQPITTTLATLQSLRTGAEVAQFPQTIRDAIEVTRKLGFRFLWIDSICIIQDSDSDKEYEINRMSTVYKNATVTIAAAVASTANEGFLRVVRNPWRFREVSWALDGQTTTTLSIAGFKPYSLRLPLHRRGWTFQESLLSRRVLQYEDLDLVWRCQTGRPRSYLSKGISSFDHSTSLPAGVFQCGLQNKPLNMTRNARHRLWNGLIYKYSARELTDKDDRLRALAGVAQELAKVWGDTYLFGLWKSCIVEQLLWFCVQGYERQARRSPRAPTWSWVSLDCHVGFCPVYTTLALAEVSGSATSREIRLLCKVVSKAEIPPGCLRDSVYDNKTDVVEDDNLDEISYFLILGKPVRKEGDYVLALKVIKAGGAQGFRRIGYAELHTFEELTSRQPCSVTLI